MADSLNKELVKQVQSSLSKHINKPQLTEKLLNKPPFKFLHDIITNVSNDYCVIVIINFYYSLKVTVSRYKEI